MAGRATFGGTTPIKDWSSDSRSCRYAAGQFLKNKLVHHVADIEEKFKQRLSVAQRRKEQESATNVQLQRKLSVHYYF